MNALQQAVDRAGSQSALARLLNVKPQAVQQWVANGEPPVKRAIQIEEVVDGEITRHDLRPDIFGPSQAA